MKQVATFRKKDPIVMGVDVEFGVLKVGTPITMYNKKNVLFLLFSRKDKKLELDMFNQLKKIIKS